MTFKDDLNEYFKEREEPKLSDFNVLVTKNREDGNELYYFIRKGRVIDVYNTGNQFGGNITSLQLTLGCDHVVKKHGMSFTILKCRADHKGTTILRLMAEYLESL